MVIQWDVDGVLASFQSAYHKLASNMFNVEIDPDYLPPTWDWLEQTIGKDKVSQLWEHIKQDRYFWADLPSLVSYGTWQRICDLDALQYFVTSRVGKTAKVQTEEWLSERFCFTPTVIVSDRKADAALALRSDYVIDDKAGNVLAVYYASPKNVKVYVLDAPYNKFSTDLVGKRVRRVTSVNQFLDDIEVNR